MNMKYLVCRKDALRPGNVINSSAFPILVDMTGTGRPDSPEAFYEAVVMKAFGQFGENYVGKHEYIVIPMNHAQVVTLRPKPSYIVSCERYV